MLRTRLQLRNEVERFIDAALAYIALTLAILIRRELSTWRKDIFPMFDFWPEAGWLYVVLLLLWVTLFDAFKLYSHRSARTAWKTVLTVVRANAVGIILAFFLFYILTIKNVPRALILLFAGLDVLFMAVKEYLIRYAEPRWIPSRNLLLVGNLHEFAPFIKRLQENRLWNANVLGVLVPVARNDRHRANTPNSSSALDPPSLPVLGTFDDLLQKLHEHSVDFVVLNPSREYFGEIQTIINLCETEGVETWLLGSFFRTSIARARVDEFQDLPMLIFSTTPAVSWALLLKRVIDVAGSLALSLLSLPLMMAAAITIKLTSPGPVIFKQRRCTLFGRPFWMYKFRTMVSEAEQLRAEFDLHNDVKGPVFKMKDDPRVTRVGRFMRRYSLDELPQLFNVLKGEMSLVGPRPPIPAEVRNYANWQRRRLSMRSGITCIWQTAGRNEIDFEDWMKLDLEYIDNWSLGLDLKILFRTPWVVLRGTGV